MEKQAVKRWEIALAAGLVIGLLATPAGAEGTVLSRWPAAPETELRYQVSLFPFGVGELNRETAVLPPREEPREIQVKFRLVEWWEEIQAATAR